MPVGSFQSDRQGSSTPLLRAAPVSVPSPDATLAAHKPTNNSVAADAATHLAELTAAKHEPQNTICRIEHADWARDQLHDPLCATAIRCLTLDSPSVFPITVFAPLSRSDTHPTLPDLHELAAKGRFFMATIYNGKIPANSHPIPTRVGGLASH